MATVEEKWNETWFRTRINTLNAPEQPVLAMVPRPHTMAAEEGVHGCCRKEVGDEKRCPCERKEMGAEEVRNDEGAEWINEEGEEDGGGGLNASNSGEVCDLQLYFGDGELISGPDGMVVISRRWWWLWFGGCKPTWRGLILIPAGFGRIVDVWTPMNNSFFVLVRFRKVPSKRNSFRGLGGVIGGFGSVSVLVFLVVEELPVGSNPSCIFGF